MDIDFYFIELPKFTAPMTDSVETIDKWVYFIKEATYLNSITEHVDDEGLKEAYRDANKHT